MKVLFVILAVLLALAHAGKVVEAEQLIKGIIEGAFVDVEVDIAGCIVDGELIFEDMEHAIDDFALAVINKDKTKLVEALNYIGDIVSRLPEELKECKDAEAIIGDVERIVAELLNPEALIIDVGEKIIWHGVSIYKDVSGSVTDFHEDRFEDAGKKIGDIIKIVLVNAVADPIENADVLLTEFWKFAFNLKLDLDTCKSEITTSLNQLIADAQTIRNCEGVEACIVQVKHLVDDAEAVYHSAEDCAVAWPTIQQGMQALMPFYKNPAGVILAISKAAVLDPVSFPKDSYNLYSALSSTPINFKLTGDASGDLVKMVLAHMPTSTEAEELLKESS